MLGIVEMRILLIGFMFIGCVVGDTIDDVDFFWTPSDSENNDTFWMDSCSGWQENCAYGNFTFDTVMERVNCAGMSFRELHLIASQCPSYCEMCNNSGLMNKIYGKVDDFLQLNLGENANDDTDEKKAKREEEEMKFYKGVDFGDDCLLSVEQEDENGVNVWPPQPKETIEISSRNLCEKGEGYLDNATFTEREHHQIQILGVVAGMTDIWNSEPPFTRIPHYQTFVEALQILAEYERAKIYAIGIDNDDEFKDITLCRMVKKYLEDEPDSKPYKYATDFCQVRKYLCPNACGWNHTAMVLNIHVDLLDKIKTQGLFLF